MAVALELIELIGSSSNLNNKKMNKVKGDAHSASNVVCTALHLFPNFWLGDRILIHLVCLFSSRKDRRCGPPPADVTRWVSCTSYVGGRPGKRTMWQSGVTRRQRPAATRGYYNNNNHNHNNNNNNSTTSRPNRTYIPRSGVAAGHGQPRPPTPHTVGPVGGPRHPAPGLGRAWGQARQPTLVIPPQSMGHGRPRGLLAFCQARQPTLVIPPQPMGHGRRRGMLAFREERRPGHRPADTLDALEVMTRGLEGMVLALPTDKQ